MNLATRQRFSAIAHGEMAIMNPLSEATLSAAIERLNLRPGDRVLDLGCGKGTFLARVVERWGAEGVGVELAPALVAEARDRAAVVRSGRMAVERADARSYRAREPFDAVVCLGPGWAHGTLGDLLTTLRSHACSAGSILVATTYWRSPPTAAYLALLGVSADAMQTHRQNRHAGDSLGLRLSWSQASRPVDFARYERIYRDTALAWARDHPADPAAAAVRHRANAIWNRHRSGGRLHLGFAIYLFQPASISTG